MRKDLDLGGDWNLWYCDPGEGEAAGIPSSGCPREGSYVGRVPGDVHVDMLRAGVIGEPLYGRNALDCRWVEEKDWWYSRTFDLSSEEMGDRIELHFAGLDTTADIWLNGAKIGHHDNQFIPYTIDVTDVVREGENLLVVRVDCGVRAKRKDGSKYLLSTNLPDVGLPRMWIRKAQFTFGWDWAPRLLTCGIWRNVELRSYRGVALRDVFLQTSLEGEVARVTAQVELEGFSPQEKGCELHLQLRSPMGVVSEERVPVTVRPSREVHTVELRVEHPSLWWPRDLGGPNLYDVSVEVSHGDEVLDRHEMRYGLRTVELIREPLPGDEGISFTFAINGEKVFCKGANWVPADSIIARVNRGKYRALLEAAVEANINTLRVWGGGIYEDPFFYQTCDELGIMVWQDFLYACSMYPDDDDAFLAEAKREAEIAVRQLRNYACLILWCGNNENEWIYQRQILSSRDLPRHYGLKIYTELLPDICARLDPSRPYWQSSPWGGDDPNSEFEGDRHHWYTYISVVKDLKKRLDFHNFTRDRGKFISEFGALSTVSLHSLRRFIPEDELYVGSPAWEFHRNTFDGDTLREVLRSYWGDPEELSLEQWILGAQVMQAEVLRFALEHFRRRKFLCSGALFWMFNDAWGASTGWTIVDYYLDRKASFYAVRNAYAPVLISFKEGSQDNIALWLANDTLVPVAGRVEYGLLDTAAGEWNPIVLEVSVGANASRRVADVLVPDLDDEARVRSLVVARFVTPDGELSRNRYLFTDFRFQDLRLAPAALRYQFDEREGGEFVYQVSADRYALMVHFEQASSEDIWFEDNWFDLLPGETRYIRVRGSEDAIRTLKVRALN